MSAATNGNDRKPVVLIVDDNPGNLASLNRLLRDEPYELIVTDRPDRALAIILERPISVLVSDQVMPEELGTELLDKVRARSPETRCLILTAYPEGRKLQSSKQRDGLQVMAKPWDDNELKQTIRAMLVAPAKH